MRYAARKANDAGQLPRRLSAQFENIRILRPDEFPAARSMSLNLAKKAGIGNLVLCTHDCDFEQAVAIKISGTKYVSLSNAMLENNDPEIVAGVLGHELGHTKMNHVLKTQVLGTISGILLFPELIAIGYGLAKLGIQSIPANVALFMAGFFAMLGSHFALMNSIQRKHELDASAYSARLNGNGEGLRKFFSSKKLRADIEEALNGYKGLKKWIVTNMVAMRFDHWDGPQFEPKNFAEKLAARFIHALFNDHPPMKKELAAIGRAEAELKNSS